MAKKNTNQLDFAYAFDIILIIDIIIVCHSASGSRNIRISTDVPWRRVCGSSEFTRRPRPRPTQEKMHNTNIVKDFNGRLHIKRLCDLWTDGRTTDDKDFTTSIYINSKCRLTFKETNRLLVLSIIVRLAVSVYQVDISLRIRIYFDCSLGLFSSEKHIIQINCYVEYCGHFFRRHIIYKRSRRAITLVTIY